MKQCKKAIEAYNMRAKQVCRREKENFMRRKQECSTIYEEELERLCRTTEVKDIEPVPKEAATKMDTIFKMHYRNLPDRLLLGRLDEISQLVNTAYAKHVAEALGKIDPRYEARAILCLHPLYGRGAALPLMTETSVEAMWEVCESYYYTVQLDTVSSTPAVVKQTLRCLSAL